MALLSDKDQKRISAHRVRPARASAVANADNGLSSVIDTIDIQTDGAKVDINHRCNVYVLTKPPTAALIPNPKIGDIAKVFIVDDSRTDNPCAYAEFHYTRTVTAAGAVSGNPAWQKVTTA